MLLRARVQPAAARVQPAAARRARGLASAAPRVDLRSDTVTTPTSAMRAAMAAAEVGDDVFGEDPTVRVLERRVAELFAKEAALFVPTGTMANLICLMAHCAERGSEYIVGDRSHMYLYEQGGSATIGGVHARVLPTAADGTLGVDGIRGAVQADDPHLAVTRLVALENTHNMCGGRVLSAGYVASVAAAARGADAALHVDGSRALPPLAPHSILRATRATRRSQARASGTRPPRSAAASASLSPMQTRSRCASRRPSARPPARSSSARARW